MAVQVNSVRGVGCVKGYPYFATGLYQVRETKAGKFVWKLVASKERHRTTNLKTCGMFTGRPVLSGVRHNKPVTAAQCAAITGVEETVAMDKVRDMM